MSEQRTALYSLHLQAGARMVPFAGWQMPLHYGSQIQEHHAVRQDAGLFDVSHMAIVDVSGADALAMLRYLLANDAARLQQPGQALYSCMLNPDCGILDDLILYLLAVDHYRLVVNAATRDSDLAWIKQVAADFSVRVEQRRLSMLAVQGPQARQRALPCLPADLRQPAAELAAFGSCRSGDWMVARTGYTGEDGLEIMLPEADAPELWQRLLAAGVRPCGLGARDSLRLEAGLNLYGSDMDGQTDPLESGLGWTVAWNPEDRDFVGRSALAARSSPRRFVGLLLLDPGVLRAGAPLLRQDRQVGEVTSGGFAPTLGRSVGMGRILPGEGDLYAELRGRRLRVKLHKPPFVKRGKICIDLDAP